MDQRAKLFNTFIFGYSNIWIDPNFPIKKYSTTIYTVKEEIGRYAEKYKERTATHRNQLAAEASKTLLEKRLKRKHAVGLTK